MRRNLLILACLLAVIPVFLRWQGQTEAPPKPQVTELGVFQFENDEGNYNDGYAEPGISYLQLYVERDPDGGLSVKDFEGNSHRCKDAHEAIALIKKVLTPRLTSYNPKTGRIEDVGVGREQGGDQFLNFERRLRHGVPSLLEDIQAL